MNTETETKSKDLTKTQASPATSFFATTNVLQPLVSKCRFGCPANKKNNNNNCNSNHIIFVKKNKQGNYKHENYRHIELVRLPR